MKKILAFILCAMLICVTPIVAFAEGDSADEVVTEGVEGENSTTTEESATEGGISAPETVPEETPVEDEVQTITDSIAKWLEEHSAEIGIIVTLIGYGIVLFKKLGTVIKSAGTMNNNTITVAKNSENAIGQALTNMESVSETVTGYRTEITLLLEQFRKTAEDKQKLEAELLEVKKYLQLSKSANVEFANELAELLSLANIPNFKKEEIGSRHLAAVNAIAEAEAKTETEEVKKDVGEEA